MAITTAMQTQVAELYVAMFNRAPEAEGLGYWVNQLDTVALGGGGLTINQVAEAMYDTEPARVIYPLLLTDAAFVTNVYTFVLGRAPDAGGLAYWTARLTSLNTASGGNGHGGLVEEIITAVNNYTGTDPAGVASKALFQNKVAAGMYYAVTLLGNDVAVATNGLLLVTVDPLSVTIQNAANAAANAAGESFTLTDAVDDINGTSKNDTITGIFGDNATATLTAGDDIDGAGGTDTLNLIATGNTASAVGVTVKNVETITIKDFSGATFNALLVESNPAINFTNTIAGNTSTVTSAGLGNTYGEAGKGNLTVDFASTSGTADTAKVALIGAGTSTSARSTIDVSDGNTIEAATVALSGTNFATLNFGTAAAKATFTGAGTNNLTIGSMAILSTLDASATTGTNTFGLGSTLNTGDVVKGGTGADTLSANFTAASLLNPTISGVETMALDYDANAIFNLSKTTGTTTIGISGSKGSATLTNAAVDVTKINLTTQATDFTDNDLTFSHATGVTAALTLTIGSTATSATNIEMDDVTLKGTSSLTLNTVGSKVYDFIGLFTIDGDQSAVNVSVGADGELILQSVDMNGGDIGALNVTVGADARFSGSFSGGSFGNVGDVTMTVGAGAQGYLDISGGDGNLGNVTLTVNGSDASGQMEVGVGSGSIGDITISVLGDGSEAHWSFSANNVDADSLDPLDTTGNIGNITINVDGDNGIASGSIYASGGDIGDISITMTGGGSSGLSGSMYFNASFVSGDTDNDGSEDDYVRGGNVGNITVDINGNDAGVDVFVLASGGDIGNVDYSFTGASGNLDLHAVRFGSGSPGGNIGDINITLDDISHDFSGNVSFDGTTGLINITAGNNVSGIMQFSGGDSGGAVLGDATVTAGDGFEFHFVVSGFGGDVSSHTATLLGDNADYLLEYQNVSGNVGAVSVTAGNGAAVEIAASGGIDSMDLVTLIGGVDDSSHATVIVRDTQTFGGVDATAWLGTLHVNLNGVNSGTFVQAGTGTGDANVSGSNFADNIFGGGGDDLLNGLNGADLILGGAGADTLNGNAGNDTIAGGVDNDTITGGTGNDSVTGGGGADRFSFAVNDNTTVGSDVITDFTAGTDKLQFTGFADVVSAQQAAVQAAVTALAAASSAATIATAMALANTTDLGVAFAVFEGNTYVLAETTGADAAYVAATDVFIKLTGVTTAPTFAADVVA